MKQYQFLIRTIIILIASFSFTAQVSAEGVPAVTTLPASSITNNQAVFTGQVTETGGVGVHRDFVYGTTTAYGTLADHDAGQGFVTDGLGNYELTITELKCNTTYHYAAHFTNANFEIATGEDQSFTTAPCAIALTITSPTPATVFEMGDPMHIAWNTVDIGIADAIEIGFFDGSVKDGFTSMIDTVMNSGAYDWVVPTLTHGNQTDVINGLGKMIVATAFTDTENNRYSDNVTVSVHFPQAPVATLITPNGGESFATGDTMHITWSSVNIPADAQVLLSIRDTRSLSMLYNQQVIASVPNTGSYDWVVPNSFGPLSNGILAGDTAYNIVLSYADSLGRVLELSDTSFSITTTDVVPTEGTCATNGGAAIAITNPLGGENLHVGDTVTIKWNTCGIFYNHPVEISLLDSRYSTETSDNGIALISADALNTGTYEWTIPESLGKLSLGKLDGENVYAVSIFTWSNLPVDYTAFGFIEKATPTFSITPARTSHSNGAMLAGAVVIPSVVAPIAASMPVVVPVVASVPPAQSAPVITTTPATTQVSVVTKAVTKEAPKLAVSAPTETSTQTAAVANSVPLTRKVGLALFGLLIVGFLIAWRFV